MKHLLIFITVLLSTTAIASNATFPTNDLHKNIANLKIKEIILDDGTIVSAEQIEQLLLGKIRKVIDHKAIESDGALMKNGGTEGGW